MVELMFSLETVSLTTGNPVVDHLESVSLNVQPAAPANNIKSVQYDTLPNNVIVVNGGRGDGLSTIPTR